MAGLVLANDMVAMTRRTLLLALLLSGILSLAHGYQCPQRSLSELVIPEQILVGKVLSLQLRPDPRVKGWGWVEAEVQVETVVRGPPLPKVRTLREPMYAGASAHGLQVHGEYVLFVQEDDLLALCGGTRPLAPVGVAREEQLQQLHE